MKIIQAQDNDIIQLAEMNQQLIKDEGHRNNMSLNQLYERMSHWLSGEYKAAIFIDKEVTGYALWRNESEYVYLRQFFIKRCFRRGGIGTKAYHLLKHNYWQDCLVRLDVLSENVIAQQFWQSIGFKPYCITMESR